MPTNTCIDTLRKDRRSTHTYMSHRHGSASMTSIHEPRPRCLLLSYPIVHPIGFAPLVDEDRPSVPLLGIGCMPQDHFCRPLFDGKLDEPWSTCDQPFFRRMRQKWQPADETKTR